MSDGKRISQLPKATTGFRDGKYAKSNPISGKTEQVGLMADLGAVRASVEWNTETIYNTGDFVLFNDLTAWESKVDGNQGNAPAENSFWTSATISPSDGITLTNHQNGWFTYNESIVLNNYAIYQLDVPAPFESTDFTTELVNNDWRFIGEQSYLIRDVTTATYTMTENDTILNVLYAGECTITIPTALITAGFPAKVIADALGDSETNNIIIVGEGGELIDGDISFIIDSNYGAINIYATNNVLKIY